MKISKNLLGRIILIIILFGLIYSLFVIEFPFSKNKKQEKHIVLQGATINSVGRPVNIIIPVLRVNSAIESVGILDDGTMGVPKGPKEVAWYSLGVPPGAIGNSVMAGHSGWKDGIAAVFDNLSKLKKGDKVEILNDNGQTVSFVVRGSHNFDPSADAKDVFVSNDGKVHLNLITCSGDWDTALQSHSKRLVVFTDKE